MAVRDQLMTTQQEVTSSPRDRTRRDGASSTHKQSSETGSSPDFLVAFASGRHDNDHTIEAFADAGLLDETVASLSFLCDVPIDVVERLMEHPETVHVLARAANLSWRSAKAILRLRTRRQDLAWYQPEQGFVRFTRLPPQTARRFLQFYCEYAPSEDERHSRRTACRLVDTDTREEIAATI
jgi:Uncharacterised protein conserved in bacteria (DUF2336)